MRQNKFLWILKEIRKIHEFFKNLNMEVTNSQTMAAPIQQL